MSAEVWTEAHRSAAGVPVREFLLRSRCGTIIPLPSGRWWSHVTVEEESVLALALAPVLDIGCGPGRHTAALTERGVEALGVDWSSAAVVAARARGVDVLHRSVFGRLPDEGGWGTALLLDGNVGIGGDPDTLFHRVRSLLHPVGRLLAEFEPPGVDTQRLHVRAELPAGATDWFPWARVGIDDAHGLAEGAGMRLVRRWTHAGRWFARLDAR